MRREFQLSVHVDLNSGQSRLFVHGATRAHPTQNLGSRSSFATETECQPGRKSKIVLPTGVVEVTRYSGNERRQCDQQVVELDRTKRDKVIYIPFDFMAAGSDLAAGEYTLETTGDTDQVPQMCGLQRHRCVFTIASQAQ